MVKLSLNQQRRFIIPEASTLLPNGPDDPLPYYYKPLIGKIYRARIEQALSLLTPPYKSILEIGYGSGILLPSLCKMSQSVFGIDLQANPERLKEPLNKLGIRCTLIQGDIADKHFGEGVFDLIVAISIFEHIAELGSRIEQIEKLLCPSGQLLVGMPRVDKYMNSAFRIIGHKNIDQIHVTDHKQLIKAASRYFNLIDTLRLPKGFPATLCLYFSLLFKKKAAY